MRRRTRRPRPYRLLSIGAVIVLAWVGVGFRLYEIQGAEAESYAARGVDQRLRREVLAAPRGTIFDRSGQELAVTVDAITVYANPREIEDPEVVAQLLAPLVDVEAAQLAERLARDAEFVYVARKLERRVADRVRESRLPGIYFIEEPSRVYPAGEMAAHVLGFVKVDDNSGLEGLELQYDDVLTGTPGELMVERDPQGRRIVQGEYAVLPAEPGSDLVLTIDGQIQIAAERALAAAVADTGAEGASAIVLDARNGQILAMANVPVFDPNRRGDADPEAFRNRAVTDVYEPGSTQKLITVAAALDAGVVVPADVFPIPTELIIADKTYTDVGTHPAELSVSDIVAYSSNIGTILIERELGDEAFHRYLSRFGLGWSTGIDFPGEADGVLRAADEWCPTTCGASTAIGYRVSVTALQMAAAFAAVANDGLWVQPHLVMEIVDGEGVRRPVQPVTRRVVSPQTASQLRVMLEGVVAKGTGSRAAVAGYRIGGKTGTTEKFIADVEARVAPDQPYGDDVVASFIGIGPIDAPRIVVAVMIDAPQNAQFGGVVAAPVFAEIMTAALHHLGVAPDA